MRPFKPLPPPNNPQQADLDETAMDDELALRFIDMEVYIVHHKHLKGGLGRITDTFTTMNADGRRTQKFAVHAFHSISAYTYEMKERDLLEAS